MLYGSIYINYNASQARMFKHTYTFNSVLLANKIFFFKKKFFLKLKLFLKKIVFINRFIVNVIIKIFYCRK